MEWPKDMLEEVEDFRLERSIRSLKTNEEIEELSVDEKLSSLDRALYLLKKRSHGRLAFMSKMTFSRTTPTRSLLTSSGCACSWLLSTALYRAKRS
ncbi:serine/threonine-protein phosphatase 4 regulatory subunit 4-like [Corticium candelabrum]|uniref:serine/threonine-protein phosphatase 4 regulatory subunit 4-like n=1 Tax=Corticium candelabrum TaxID=121492 RepID=UPI002E2531DD|nr:serine/threonine-protein phosphatase 4 regulatory subunit 4-like [Corticium candelabrum]